MFGRALFFQTVLFLFLSITTFADFTGSVVGISDGDTIKVLKDKEEIKIRLWGIDAPEKNQDFGNQSKKYLSDLIFGKIVTVLEKGTDRYERILGIIKLEDRDINEEMLRAGMAWWFRKYAPHEEKLKFLEQEAREQKRGFWIQPNPVPPWEWRKEKKLSLIRKERTNFSKIYISKFRGRQAR